MNPLDDHTPGPWAVFSNGHCVSGPASDGAQAIPTAGVAMCGMTRRGPVEVRANAYLIAQAPAMKLALQIMLSGIGRMENHGHIQTFCFEGRDFAFHGDWSALIDQIGWDKARAHVAEALS